MQILYVEDDFELTQMVKRRLEQFRDTVLEVTTQRTLEGALAFLKVARPDVVLLDLGLPDSKGVESYRAIQAAAPEVPVVVISATDERDVVVSALREGAHDYITKGKLDPLAITHILENAVRKHEERMKKEMERQNDIQRWVNTFEKVERPEDAIEVVREVTKELRNMLPQEGDFDAED